MFYLLQRKAGTPCKVSLTFLGSDHFVVAFFVSDEMAKCSPERRQNGPKRAHFLRSGTLYPHMEMHGPGLWLWDCKFFSFRARGHLLFWVKRTREKKKTFPQKRKMGRAPISIFRSSALSVFEGSISRKVESHSLSHPAHFKVRKWAHFFGFQNLGYNDWSLWI